MNKAKRLFIGLAVALAAIVALPANTAAIQTQIEDIVRETAQRQGVPGIAVAIVRDSEEVIFVSYGYARSGVAADENTFFGLGSLSKSFTALGLLYLDYSDEFDFSLSDSVTRFIPWLKFRYAEGFDMAELTVADLTHHTSGITNTSHSLRLPPSEGETAAYEVVRLLNGARLDFRPGEQYEYGSANYIIIGLIIQNVTGTSFEEFMSDRVLVPLGLQTVKMFEADATAAGVMAAAHKPAWFASRPFTPPVFRAHTPTGFIIANASDMARWMQLHLNPHTAPAPFDRLIPLSQQPNTSVAAVDGMYYAAGWLVDGDLSLITHQGESPGFMAEIAIFPDSGLGVVVLMNSFSGDTSNLMANIVNIVNGEPTLAISSGSEFRLFDNIFGIISIAAMVLILLVVVLLVRKIVCIVRKQHKEEKPRVGRLVLPCVVLVVFGFVLTLTLLFPTMFNVGTWAIANIWLPPTVFMGFILLNVLSVLSLVLTSLAAVYRKPTS